MPEFDGIILGSPTRFGNMLSQMKELWDHTSGLWMEAKPVGKVDDVFTGSVSTYGGHETTAVVMMFPMLYHGMVIIEASYTVKELFITGSPYGPSSIVGANSDKLNEADLTVDKAHGKRIDEIASKLFP